MWPSIVALFICLNFCHAYGAVENRLFKECGEYFPGQHFRLYHLWLATLDFCNAVIVYALSLNPFLTLFALVYFPFGLDLVWWLIRYIDFHRDRIAAEKFYGEPNAWCQQADWDNYLGFSLIFRVYWWWLLFGIISVILGGLSLC